MQGIIPKIMKSVRIKYNKLQFVQDNRKIKTKTVYVYIFCVLVPTMITNMFIIGNMTRAAQKELQEKIKNVAESISQGINSSLENAVYLTVDLYANNSICSFLDTQYKNDAEYIEAYNKVFDIYVFYATSMRMVNDLAFYSDNATMINGGRYFRVDSIKKEEWYQQFVQSNEDIFVYSCYMNNYHTRQKNRYFSLIRKLDYIGMDNIEKIVKLDLNYNKINEAVRNSAFAGTVYVCHEDDIIFSNDVRDKGIKGDYMKISAVDLKKMQVHKTVSVYGYDMDIYLTSYKSNYITMIKNNLWLILGLLLANALIPAIALNLFSKSIIKRILLLGKYIKKVKEEKFELIYGSKGSDEIGELMDNYNLMASRMKNLIEYEYKSKLERQELHLARKQAELLALHSQINPHFMFNVLESIRMHCVIKGEDETSEIIESLARLMRKSAEWGSDLITIKQEIGFTEDYLKLQKHRYGEEFSYKLHINENCYRYMIPSMVLATFVENSCVHGLNREGYSGTVFIWIYEENDNLYMEVEDTGIGIEEGRSRQLEKLLNEADIDDLQKTNSLGMLNACIRLKKYCGEQTKISIESEIQVGTCITIEIPIKNMKKES